MTIGRDDPLYGPAAPCGARVRPRIVWTRHAHQRQLEWELSLGVTIEQVENLIIDPQHVVAGDEEALIAQARYRSGLLRVVFRDTVAERRILTLYWTSRVDRYWRE